MGENSIVSQNTNIKVMFLFKELLDLNSDFYNKRRKPSKKLIKSHEIKVLGILMVSFRKNLKHLFKLLVMLLVYCYLTNS